MGDARREGQTSSALELPGYDLTALAATAVILVMMGLPWVSTTLYTGDQGLVQFAIGGDNRFAIPTNAPPDLASNLRELQPIVEWGHLLVALALPAGMRAALRLRFGRAAIGSLAAALTAFSIFSLLGRWLAAEDVQVYVALLVGGVGVLLGSAGYFVAWWLAGEAGVDPEALKERMEREPGRRRSAYRALEVATYVAFTLAAFTLDFGVLGASLILGGALGLGVVMLLLRQGAARQVVELGLMGLAVVYLVLLFHVVTIGPPALFALVPLAGIGWAWRAVQASPDAFTPPRAPQVAAGLLALALVLGGTAGGLVVPFTTTEASETAVLSTGPETPPPSQPQELLFLPDVDEERTILRAYDEGEEPTLNTSETVPVAASSSTTFVLDPPLDARLALEPGEPISVAWTFQFDAQPAPVEVRLRVLDGERTMAQATREIPPAAGVLEPVTVYANMTPAREAFEENVVLEVELDGVHVGGRHVLNESALVVRTPPGFVSVT